ncbi:MAG: F510_1955 family glycosylhydrolase [Armatimonadota bacterium]
MGERRSSGQEVNVGWWAAAILGVLLVAIGLAMYFGRPTATTGSGGSSVSAIDHIHALVSHPRNPDLSEEILWLGTHSGLVRVTGGKRWVHVGRTRYDLMGLTAHPTAPNVLLASGHPGEGDQQPNPLGVLITRNAGESWQPLALTGEVDFHAIAISRADPQVLYAWNVSGRVGLHRSRDGGRTWEVLGARGLDRVLALAAHPRRATVLLAGTMRGLFVSEDAGDTWRALGEGLRDVPVTAIDVHPSNPQIMYAYASRRTLGLMRTEDGGTQWTAVGFSLEEPDAVLGLALDSSNPHIVFFATQGGDLYRSSDAGKSREQYLSRGRVVAP